jgi:hypothetical protein
MFAGIFNERGLCDAPYTDASALPSLGGSYCVRPEKELSPKPAGPGQGAWTITIQQAIAAVVTT